MNFLHVSIVTFKTESSLVRRCLACIFASKISVYVTIIDNSPTDDLSDAVSDFKIDYIHNPSNPGYGAAHNIAMRNSLERGFQYHLVLNADVYFEKDTLEIISSYMTNNPSVGQIMPRILNTDGSIQRVCKLLPSPFDLLLRRFVPAFLYLRRRRQFELWDSGYDKIMFVPYLSGCFMFFRCSVLKDVGVFDERFFMYPEDIDLTRRVAMRHDTLFFPLATATHEHGAASQKSLRMFFIHAYNIVKYFNKWGWFFDKNRAMLNRKTLDSISR